MKNTIKNKKLKSFHLNNSETFSYDTQTLFDDAVKLSLSKNKKYFQKEIIEGFIQSFLIENKIKDLDLYFFKPSKEKDCDAFAYLDKAVYFKEKIFKTKKLQFDISVFFHELSHIKSYIDNTNNYLIGNKDFKTYFSFNYRFKIPSKLNYALYYMSSNELNSRIKEIEYSKRFIERANYILKNEPEYDNKSNKKILKKFVKDAAKLEQKTNENIKIFTKIKNSNKHKMEKRAQECLKFIKNFDQKNSSLTEKNALEVKTATDFLICYFGTYKDESLFNETFEYLLTSKNSVLNKKKKPLLQTNCKTFKKEDIDSIIFLLNDYSNTITSLLNNEDIAKHNLLFYGSFDCQGVSQYNNKSDKNNAIKKTQVKLKDYIFTGVPYKHYYDENKEQDVFELVVKGEKKVFYTLKDLMLMACKYINSAWLDNLNEENVKKINSVFNKEIVIDFTKENKCLKQKEKNFSYVNNSKNLNLTNEYTF